VFELRLKAEKYRAQRNEKKIFASKGHLVKDIDNIKLQGICVDVIKLISSNLWPLRLL